MNDKPQFTPGPWSLKPFTITWAGTNVMECNEIKTSEKLIATVDGNENNARLIAAAPDLYVALKVAKELLGCNWLRANAPHTLKVIDKALAKAEGRENDR